MNLLAIQSMSQTMTYQERVEPRRQPRPVRALRVDTAFGCPRDPLNNRFVYITLSSRARGLSVGVNLNPDKRCNFDCVYCEVNRGKAERDAQVDVDVMAEELLQTLRWAHDGGVKELPRYSQLPAELLRPRHVALSGDGEPTQCAAFAEAVQAVVHVRAVGSVPVFKMVLITNTTGLNRPAVQEGLKYFTSRDEVWAKLEAGTQAYMDKINRPGVSLESIQSNILSLAQQRPVIIQSLFPAVNGEGPSDEEITQYALRLKELKDHGAQIPLVQIYSATRPTPHSECGHLPLMALSRIAQAVTQTTGLKAEVF